MGTKSKHRVGMVKMVVIPNVRLESSEHILIYPKQYSYIGCVSYTFFKKNTSLRCGDKTLDSMI